MTHRVLFTMSIIMALAVSVTSHAQDVADIAEFPLAWPGKTNQPPGSTHEITYNHKGGKTFWVTGQKYDHIARVALDGKSQFFAMPAGSGPHGILFDAEGQLWVSLEFLGRVVQVGNHGEILKEIDVRLHVKGTKTPINTNPHGLGLGADGKTIWFTGKKTSTIGKINPNGSVEHFELPTIGAVPIYLAAGPRGDVWCTELVGNKIARISPNGKVREIAIPTANSRPIAIAPGPDGKSMWFSEEAGKKVARIDIDDEQITEFPVPSKQKNVILAGLAFDGEGNLWTHSYVDQNNPQPEGPDHVIRIDKSISNAAAGDTVPMTYYEVPSRRTIMHRIIQGPDDHIWFTELGIDKVGRLSPAGGQR